MPEDDKFYDNGLIYGIIQNDCEESVKAEFHEHIKTCEKCRKAYDEASAIQNALRSDAAPGDDFTAKTMARIKAAKKPTVIRITKSPVFKGSIAAAACLVLGVFIVSSGLLNKLSNSDGIVNAESILTTSGGSNDIADNGIADFSAEPEASFFADEPAADEPEYESCDEETECDDASSSDYDSNAGLYFITLLKPKVMTVTGSLADSSASDSVDGNSYDESYEPVEPEAESEEASYEETPVTQAAPVEPPMLSAPPVPIPEEETDAPPESTGIVSASGMRVQEFTETDGLTRDETFALIKNDSQIDCKLYSGTVTVAADTVFTDYWNNSLSYDSEFVSHMTFINALYLETQQVIVYEYKGELSLLAYRLSEYALLSTPETVAEDADSYLIYITVPYDYSE